MNITAWAIRNNRVTWVILFAVLLGGFSAYQSMPRAEDPGFEFRFAQVVTVFPGASPERVEQLVTDKLETAIQELPELKKLTSESRSGVSVITLEVDDKFDDLQPIWDNLRRKVDRTQSELPEGVRRSVVNDEFGEVFGVVVGITGEGYDYAELKEVADSVRDTFLLLDSVSKVDIYGAQEERLFIEYDNAHLAELGLSPGQLLQTLASRNIIIPGGTIDTSRESFELEPSGSFESVEDVASSLVRLPSGDVLAIRDIAQVRRGYIDPPETKVSVAGQPGLTLALAMHDHGNILELGKEVRELKRQLEINYPIGLEFDLVFFQPDDVQRIITNFRTNLLQAIAVVTLVMLVALGLRTGLIVASLIPLSLVAALLVMSSFDIWIDQVSLCALILALGMLVDNSIVMVENTMVQMEQGQSRLEAAISSANELRVPLLTASLTTAAAFLPIVLAENTTGEYMAPLFKVVVITLLSSWVIALTVIPMLCVAFLKAKPKSVETNRENKLFYKSYRGLLRVLLRYPAVTLLLTVAVFLFAMQGFKLVPSIFFPASDKPVLKVQLELPRGTPVARTEAVVKRFENLIETELLANEERPEGVRSWASYIGGSGPRFVMQHFVQPNRSHSAFIQINTTSDVVGDHVIAKLKALGRDIPDLKLDATRIEFGPPVEFPVEFRLSGTEPDRLFDIADQVKAELAKTGMASSIDDNWGARTKKLSVRIDEARARRAGVTNEDIAISLQSALSGLELTQFREGDKIIPVLLRSANADSMQLGQLSTLNVYSQASGKNVPLLQVADVNVEWQPSRVMRLNRNKTVTVTAEVVPGYTAAEVNAQIIPWLDEAQKGWAPGYRWTMGGEVEKANESNAAIGVKAPIGMAVILLLLVIQFNSIRNTIIVLMTIPLALIGVVVGLIVGESYMGFTTTLGIISLAGIVINNAIMLLERIELEKTENGLSPQAAIYEAAQRRARPILLTTATTVLGMMPLWMGGGRMWEPLAISIIFGLLFSTILTLGVIPALYAMLFRVKFKGYEHQVAVSK